MKGIAAAAATLAVTVSLAGCGQAKVSAPRPPPVPGPGVITGLYFEHDAADRSGGGVRGVTIGAFDRSFIPGTLVFSPPPPVAHAATGGGGVFRLTGLSPGRYFVAATDPRAVTAGRWVTITARHGASVVLLGCTDCPPLA